jgi:two-component system sensor histidine kinase KdpD
MSVDELDRSPSGVRVVAALDAAPTARIVVQRAKRLADLAHAPWEAVHVVTPESERASRSEREALLEAFRLAEALGAETRTLNGDDPAAELVAYARRQGVTHIVVGAPSRPFLAELFRSSTTRRLVRDAYGLAVEVCPVERRAGTLLDEMLRSSPPEGMAAYFFAAFFVALATLVALPLERTVGLPNVSLVYVLAVIAAAIRYGAPVAIFAAVLSSLAYNFFLTEPYYTFVIADPSDVWAVFFFLAVGVAVSGVAARARAQTIIARRQAAQAADLQAYAHSLVGAEEESQIAASTAETASKLLQARAVVLVLKHGDLEAIAETPGPEMLGADDLKAAKWAFTHRGEAGRGGDAIPEARWLFVPAPGEHDVAGVVGVRPFDDAAPLDPEKRRILDLIADQAGVALDRATFARKAADARVETESERLKSVLLSSMSHDLRTPLATIRGAIESVLRYEDKYDRDMQRKLMQDAATEAEKLTGFVQNLLDMAQIDAGGVRAKPESLEAADIVDAAIDRSYRTLGGKFVSRDIKVGLPRIKADRALTESALANVIENAGKYSPAESTILVRASRQGDSVAIEILDEGPGFPAGAPPQLFGRFVRGVEGDGRPPGTGLGLAIARGFLEAQDATIEAENRSDRKGALVRIILPVDK